MSHARERAFTIVEVLVAALIITMVVAGMVYFIAGAGRSQQKGGLRQQMVAHHDRVLQTVRAERTWLDACGNPCRKIGKTTDITPHLTIAEGDTSESFTHQASVTGIDSDADGQGDADRDGLQLDLYRVYVKVTPTPATAAKVGGTVAPFESVSTVDASAIGKATGTLIVDVCGVTEQIDERMAISGCVKGAESSPLRPQPNDCPSDKNSFLSKAELDEAPAFPFQCNAALNHVNKHKPAMGGLTVYPAKNVSFQVISTEPGGKTYSSSDMVVRDASSFVFAGIPAGAYQIKVTNPGADGQGRKREIWKSRMVPSGSIASVQANQDARALIVVRPVQGNGTYLARFGRQTYHYRLEKEVTQQVRSVSATVDGNTFTVYSTYTYEWMVPKRNGVKKPKREQWWGPAWTGYVGMGPKPFDRIREKNRFEQWITGVGWNGTNNSSALAVSDKLGTGLYSLPVQINVGPWFMSFAQWHFGSFGTRFRCPTAAGPKGPTGTGCTPASNAPPYAWLKVPNGPNDKVGADSSVFFYSKDGECWVTAGPGLGSVWPFKQPTLVGGATQGKRCTRDINLGKATIVHANGKTEVLDKGKDVHIKDFYPTKSGAGGKRYLIGMSRAVSCGSCPPIKGGNSDYGGGTSDQGNEFDVDANPTPDLPFPLPPLTVTNEDGEGVDINVP